MGQGLGLALKGLAIRVKRPFVAGNIGSGFRVSGLGFGVWGLGLRV